MTTAKLEPGWLPIVGGPWDGCEHYGADFFPAGKHVGMPLTPDESDTGYYVMGLNRDRIEWKRRPAGLT